MTTFPVAGHISDNARTQGDVKTDLEAIIAAATELLGGKAETTLTLASDACTPVGAVHSIDTEGLASTDNLATLAQTNHPDGRVVIIRAANAARTVVVKHNAGGTGQIALADGVDFSLVSTKMWLMLKRTGTSWEEIFRYYGDKKALGRLFQQIGDNVLTKSGAYTVVAADRSKLIVATGSWTLGLTAAATLADGFMFALRNEGSGTIIIDPNASETIDTATTISVGPGEAFLVYCDGTGFHTVGRIGTGATYSNFALITGPGSGTWPNSTNAVDVIVAIQGAGGGGGAASGSGTPIGSSGSPGACITAKMRLSGSVAYSVGAKGAKGTFGGNGTAGGDTTFNGITAKGGPAGRGSNSSATAEAPYPPTVAMAAPTSSITVIALFAMSGLAHGSGFGSTAPSGVGTPFGTGGVGTNFNGGNATGYGASGAAGYDGGFGGDGADGCIAILY